VEVKQVLTCGADAQSYGQAGRGAREARARKILHASGEVFDAAQKLVDAAALLATEPMTLQLRYLQTPDRESGVEKNTTIVFPAAAWR